MTRMSLQIQRTDHWPPLAWLATCRTGNDIIMLRHGPGVEIQPGHWSEAIWAGDFKVGDLDETDLIFGSGARLRDNHITFISSASTVDRLVYMERPDGTRLISNSLPCLLAAVGGECLPGYRQYSADFDTITHGLNHYKRDIPTSAGPLRLLYHRNLRWDGSELRELDKPGADRTFTSFEHYDGFLRDALDKMAANMRSPARRRPLTPLATMSSGYDSPAVATLGREIGLQQVISIDRSTRGGEDCGQAIADRLGLHCTVAGRDDWRAFALAEPMFIASNAGGNDIFLAAFHDRLAGSVLLTGFHGGALWYCNEPGPSPELRRSDHSGLSLAEYRLIAGFVHAPVPFLGARSASSIHAIANSLEMAPWHKSNHDYCRPIPRRILETAGVPGDLFARRKQGASVPFHYIGGFLSGPALDDFECWLDEHREAWPKGRRPSALKNRRAALSARIRKPLVHLVNRAGELSAVTARLRRRLPAYLLHLPIDKRNTFLFPWAVERLTRRYRINADDITTGAA